MEKTLREQFPELHCEQIEKTPASSGVKVPHLELGKACSPTLGRGEAAAADRPHAGQDEHQEVRGTPRRRSRRPGGGRNNKFFGLWQQVRAWHTCEGFIEVQISTGHLVEVPRRSPSIEMIPTRLDRETTPRCFIKTVAVLAAVMQAILP